MLRLGSVQVMLGGVEILGGIDLVVASGEWVTVIGPNGAGKSTLLRAVGGALPFTGSIQIDGVETATLHRRKRAQLVASVAQQPTVPPGMRVIDYVLLGRTPYVPPLGRESGHDLEIAQQRIRDLDLVRFADRELETLSGGERQRAFLARALAQDAPLLLLDEPTSALDIGHQQEVLELVDNLRAEHGLTVLATMHDLSIAGEYADRLALLADGGLAAVGTPAQVLTEELLRVYYRAKVRVIAGDYGPIIVPVRSPAPPS